MMWIKALRKEDLPINGSTAILYKGAQIAIFNFTDRDEVYATQNFCPHKNLPVLGRGITGDQNGLPKVACPMHKRTFQLDTGTGISDPEYSIRTYKVKEEHGFIFVEVPEDPGMIPGSSGMCNHKEEK